MYVLYGRPLPCAVTFVLPLSSCFAISLSAIESRLLVPFPLSEPVTIITVHLYGRTISIEMITVASSSQERGNEMRFLSTVTSFLISETMSVERTVATANIRFKYPRTILR